MTKSVSSSARRRPRSKASRRAAQLRPRRAPPGRQQRWRGSCAPCSASQRWAAGSRTRPPRRRCSPGRRRRTCVAALAQPQRQQRQCQHRHQRQTGHQLHDAVRLQGRAAQGGNSVCGCAGSAAVKATAAQPGHQQRGAARGLTWIHEAMAKAASRSAEKSTSTCGTGSAAIAQPRQCEPAYSA